MRQYQTIFSICIVSIFLFCVMGLPLQAIGGERFAETFGERTSGVINDAENLQKRAMHELLVKNQVGAAIDRPIIVNLTAEDLRAITAGSANERKVLVGVEKKISASVDLANVSLRPDQSQVQAVGAARGKSDGGFVWTAMIRSSGVTGMRLQLSRLSLPKGSALYIYNRAGEAFGPYTGKGPLKSGEFWSHSLSGDELIVQLHQSGQAAGKSVHFEIRAVGLLGPRFVPFAKREALLANEFCSYNAPCVVNAACGGSSAVNTAEDAVALILFTSGGFLYICSGGLMADTDISTQIPYFLTANHCISKSREANSVETFFQFKTACGTCNDSLGQPDTLGASIVSTNRTSDYTLLQLQEAAPAGSAFLGWNSTPVAFSNNTPLFRISHPQGAPQAYSEHAVDTSKPTCNTWPRGNWIYSRDALGATEGGSSGSPVVNGAGQVVGQLSGACGFNVNDSCDAESNATVDGAFAAYFSQVEQFLDPSGGTCSPAGASCTSDSDCCSDRCRGKEGSKSCR